MSSGIQVDGSTTIEVDGGARGASPYDEEVYDFDLNGFGGSDGASSIVSNTNVIIGV